MNEEKNLPEEGEEKLPPAQAQDEEVVRLTAYNVRTKEKGCPILNAVITKTAKGAYMVQGDDGKGSKLTTLVNQEKALKAISQGVAQQGW